MSNVRFRILIRQGLELTYLHYRGRSVWTQKTANMYARAILAGHIQLDGYDSITIKENPTW